MFKDFGKLHNNMFKNSNRILNNFGIKKFGRKNDWDFDGVPNKKDCQPHNTMRQDFRLPMHYGEWKTIDYKEFNKRSPYGDRVVYVPTQNLYWMRAKYNLPDNRNKYMFANLYRKNDPKALAIRVPEFKKQKEAEGYIVYPNRVKTNQYGTEEATLIKYKLPARKHIENIRTDIMLPQHSSEEFFSFGGTEEEKGKYLQGLREGIESKERKVPMLNITRYNIEEGATGEGRHRIIAAQKAGWKTMPILVESDVKDEMLEKQFGKGQVYYPEKGYEDNDGDGVPNAFDCQPNNSNEQGWHNRMQKRIHPVHFYMTDEEKEKMGHEYRGSPPYAFLALKKRQKEEREYLEQEHTNEIVTNINKKFAIKKKKGIDDDDDDGVPNAFDCQPNNPDKQDKLNQEMRSRVNALPIYIYPGEKGNVISMPNRDIKNEKIIHISKQGGGQFKQLQNQFFGMIKAHPQLITDIKNSGVNRINIIGYKEGRDKLTGCAITGGEEKKIVHIGMRPVPNISTGENAEVLYHELGHIQHYDKNQEVYNQMSIKDEKNVWDDREQEKYAEEYKRKKIAKRYDPENIERYEKAQELYDKEQHSRGFTPRFILRYKTNKAFNKIEGQQQKEMEENIKSGMNYTFNEKINDKKYGYEDNDNDGVINAEDCEPNNPNEQGSVHGDMYKKILENKERRRQAIVESAQRIQTEDQKQAAYEALRMSAERAREKREQNVQELSVFRHDIKNMLANKPIAIDLRNKRILQFNEEEAGEVANELDREVESFMIKDKARAILAYKLYGKQEWELTKEEGNHINYLIRQNVR